MEKGRRNGDIRIWRIRRVPAVAAAADCIVFGRTSRVGSPVRRTGSVVAPVGSRSVRAGGQACCRASGTNRCFSPPTRQFSSASSSRGTSWSRELRMVVRGSIACPKSARFEICSRTTRPVRCTCRKPSQGKDQASPRKATGEFFQFRNRPGLAIHSVRPDRHRKDRREVSAGFLSVDCSNRHVLLQRDQANRSTIANTIGKTSSEDDRYGQDNSR